MAHDILTKPIDTVLHVQFLDAWRYLRYLVIVALLLTHSGSRNVGIHGRRKMRVDCIHAM